jgi:PAS domain S-box-containing protein
MTSPDTTDSSSQGKWSAQVALLEHTGDAIVMADADCRVSVWTKSAERMYGWTAADVLGHDLTAVARLDLSDEQRREIRRATRDTGRWRGEAKAHHKDGRPIEVELTIAALKDGEGELDGFLGIHRDLTERKRSDRVLASITDGMLGLNREWCCTYVDDRALGRLGRELGRGLTREGVLGKSVWELLPESIGTEFAERLHEAMREHRIVECVNYLESTDEFLEAHVYPSEDGLSIYYRDVTKSTRAEQQLAYHAQMFETLEDAVLVMDEQFVLTGWNRGAEEMFGWTADEAVGRVVHELTRSSFSDAESAQAYEALVTAGRWRGEGIWYGKDAKPVIADSLTVALRSEQGVVTSYLSIVRDVSERWRAREELAIRARQQALVAGLGLRARSSENLLDLFDDALALVAGMLDVELAVIAEAARGGEKVRWRAALGWSRDAIANMTLNAPGPGTLLGYALSTGEPVISEDVNTDERFTISPTLAEQAPVSAVAVMIPGPTVPFGGLLAASREHRSFTSDDVNLMQTVANVLGIAVERSRVDERFEKERENERRRIARDLHDEGLRELTDALALATVARSASEERGDEERWAGLIASLQRASQQVRGSIYNLRLAGRDDRPFADLLTELVAIHGDQTVECQLQLHGQEVLPASSLGHRGVEVLRIVGEAITNARRHSGTRTIRVDACRPSRDILRLEVSDDGQSPDRGSPNCNSAGTGITGMLERADLLGAELEIESCDGGGTVVRLELALPADEAGR